MLIFFFKVRGHHFRSIKTVNLANHIALISQLHIKSSLLIG